MTLIVTKYSKCLMYMPLEPRAQISLSECPLPDASVSSDRMTHEREGEACQPERQPVPLGGQV